jgi:hypothetical protein
LELIASISELGSIENSFIPRDEWLWGTESQRV